MTTRYNKKIASIALGLMTFSFAVPFSVFAEGTTVKTNENNFCTKLPQIATKLHQELLLEIQSYKEKEFNVLLKLSTSVMVLMKTFIKSR